jgi:hypothetical protein
MVPSVGRSSTIEFNCAPDARMALCNRSRD